MPATTPALALRRRMHMPASLCLPACCRVLARVGADMQLDPGAEFRAALLVSWRAGWPASLHELSLVLWAPGLPCTAVLAPSMPPLCPRLFLQEARAVGARYVLGDRPISVTMARTWAALSGWEKARLLGSLLWTGVR